MAEQRKLNNYIHIQLLVHSICNQYVGSVYKTREGISQERNL